MRWFPQGEEGIVQFCSAADGAVSPISRMRIEAIGETVEPLISLWVGIARRLDEAEAHHIVLNVITILAVVEQTHPVIPLR